MNTILEMLSRGAHQLIARFDGPLHFRLVVMPIVVTLLAVRAHLRDVREGRPTVLWAFVKDPVERRRLFRVALEDIGRVFVVATVMDTAYQLWVFRWIYPVQLLVVAVACALVPYVLVRGPITRIARVLHSRWVQPAAAPGHRAERGDTQEPDAGDRAKQE